MHEEFLSFVGSQSSEVSLAFASHEKLRERAALVPGIEDQSVVMTDLGSPGLNQLVAVRLMGEASEFHAPLVSEFLRAASALQFLGLANGVFEKIGAVVGGLPSLVTLEIVDRPTTRIPSDFHSSSLRRLICRRLKASEEVVSQLEHLDVNFDKDLAILLRSAVRLQTLNLQSVPHEFYFAEVPAQIIFLGIRGGRIDSLEGIRLLVDLRGLWLQGLRSISLKSLVNLHRLEELTVGYCKDLQNLESLREVRSLRAVHFFGCGLSRSSIEGLLPGVRVLGAT